MPPQGEKLHIAHIIPCIVAKSLQLKRKKQGWSWFDMRWLMVCMWGKKDNIRGSVSVCIHECVHEIWQTHTGLSCSLCGVIYFKEWPRRRSKSRISRVDLPSTAFYSVSSSTHDHTPPSFAQTCSSPVILRLQPCELPGLLWSRLLFAFMRAINGGKWAA